MVVHAQQLLGEWLTPAELAERLCGKVSESTVRRNIHTGHGPTPPGKIKGIRIGRQLLVHISVYQAMSRQSQKPESGDRGDRFARPRKDRWANL